MKISFNLLISGLLLSGIIQSSALDWNTSERWDWEGTYNYLNAGQDTAMNNEVRRLTTKETEQADGSIVVENINADQYLELYVKINTEIGDSKLAAQEELSRQCSTANSNDNRVNAEACMNGNMTAGMYDYNVFVNSLNFHQPRIDNCLSDFGFEAQYKESDHDDIRDSGIMGAGETDRNICNEYGSFNHINERVVFTPAWTQVNSGSDYGYDRTNFNIPTSNSNNRVTQVYNSTCGYLNSALGTNLHHSSLCQYTPNNFTDRAGTLCGNPSANHREARSIWPGLTESYTESYSSTCTRRESYRTYSAPTCSPIGGCSGGGWKTNYFTVTYSCTKTRTRQRVNTGTFAHTNSNIPAVCNSVSGSANSIRLIAPEPNMDTYNPNKNGQFGILGSIYRLNANTDDFVKNRVGLRGCDSDVNVQFYSVSTNMYNFYEEKRTINPLKYQNISNLIMPKVDKGLNSETLARCYY